MSAPAEERAGELGLTGSELREAWPVLSTEERLEGLQLLTHAETETVFFGMHAHDQADLLLAAPLHTRRSLMRFLPPTTPRTSSRKPHRRIATAFSSCWTSPRARRSWRFWRMPRTTPAA